MGADSAAGIPDGVLPWTRSCFVCGEANPHGLRLRSRVEGGRVVLDYTPREADLGWRHLVHGGIAMTLLDEVMTWAAILAARRACVAAELTVRLRKPILVGRPLRIEAEITGGKARLLTARGTVRDASGAEAATATGKYMPMSDDQVSLCEKDFVPSTEALDPSELLGRSGR